MAWVLKLLFVCFYFFFFFWFYIHDTASELFRAALFAREALKNALRTDKVRILVCVGGSALLNKYEVKKRRRIWTK